MTSPLEQASSPGPDAGVPSLGELSLRRGDKVRFRRAAGQRWSHGLVEARERDGSVALRDDKGASRAIRPELLEVCRSRQGRVRWEAVTVSKFEQLTLLDAEPARPARPSRRSR